MISPEFVELTVSDPDDEYPLRLVIRVDDIVSVRDPKGVEGAPYDYCEVTDRTGKVHLVTQSRREIVRAMVVSGRCQVTNNPEPYSKTRADRDTCGAG